jgi:hypothetical protein
MWGETCAKLRAMRVPEAYALDHSLWIKCTDRFARAGYLFVKALEEADDQDTRDTTLKLSTSEFEEAQLLLHTLMLRQHRYSPRTRRTPKEIRATIEEHKRKYPEFWEKYGNRDNV